MRRFIYHGQVFANINGKDFFLLRCYEGYGRPLFYQVSGRTPLRETDLDSPRTFGLIQTVTRFGAVATVFSKEHFSYRDAADHTDLVFVGATTAGSYALALRFFAERFAVPTDWSALTAAASQARKDILFDELLDHGNSGQAAVRIRVGHVTRDALESLRQKVSARADTPAVSAT